MTVTATFLHSHPQHQIASAIRNRLAGCRTAEIVSGFATPDGVDALRAKSVSSKIKRLVLVIRAGGGRDDPASTACNLPMSSLH
jgi:hypothetical protein